MYIPACKCVLLLLCVGVSVFLIAQIDLQSKSLGLPPKAPLTVDRILWTAHKVCNEYLSLFIFARFRYFNVSLPLFLLVSMTCGAICRHATQRKEYFVCVCVCVCVKWGFGGLESGRLCTTMHLIYFQVHCLFSGRYKKKLISDSQRKKDLN